MPSQFALCEGEHSLRHIEKLAKAVHSKEGKMGDGQIRDRRHFGKTGLIRPAHA